MSQKGEEKHDLSELPKVETLRPLKTLGSHIVELNSVLNLQPDEKNKSSPLEQEKIAIKRAVLDYVSIRNRCLNLT